MKAKPPQLPMQEEQIRTALDRRWRASPAGDANAEHDIYDEDAICDYPQSDERTLGNGDSWITQYTIAYPGRLAYTVSIMQFRNGKVAHETQYFADPFAGPAWRRQWAQQIA